MPVYQLHRLIHPGGDPDPALELFYGDEAAIRFAMGGTFSEGCDIWQGGRYVGRVHSPAPRDSSAAARPSRRRRRPA